MLPVLVPCREEKGMGELDKVHDAVCNYCGCLCDDLEVTIEDNKITKVSKACTIGKNRLLSPVEPARCRVDGQEASLDDALAAAAKILSKAKNPLIYGLSSTTCEAQKKAVEIAEITGASLDSTSSVCHGPGSMARQMEGLPTCTLGEVKNRADLIVFWGCNPSEAHLRHSVRYSVTPKGMYVPEGKKGRKVVVVDVRKTPSEKMADVFIQPWQGYDYECISVLRALLAGQSVAAKEVGGVSIDTWKDLLETMRNAQYGVFFFGMGLTMTRGKFNNIRNAIALVRDLNKFTRFTVIPMRGHGNVTGAEQTVCWQTGFPFAVNFSRGFARYNPGEYTAVDLLARGEADAALILASDPGAHFPAPAVEHLRKIPVVMLDSEENCTSEVADVVIPVAAAGISAEGTAYRMDNVPLRLKKLVDSPYLPDEQVLEMLKERILPCTR